jgi:DNA-binding transcriptional regulator YhcF (GntR family)
MLLTIDLESEQPIYLQIKNGIVEGIASGKLKEGDTLPPVRALASELGVNLHTVNKAYQMLKLGGFVKLLRKRGTVISAGGQGRDSEDFMEAAAENLKNIVSEAIARSVHREQLIGIINRLYNELEGNLS